VLLFCEGIENPRLRDKPGSFHDLRWLARYSLVVGEISHTGNKIRRHYELGGILAKRLVDRYVKDIE
jgi:hypothetical protein